MQMVGADWLRSDKREDDLAGRPGSIVQVDFELVFLIFDVVNVVLCPSNLWL